MPRPTALGAYIFAGGFTVGVKRHFDVLAHLEGDGGYGASSVRLNYPKLPIFYGPDRWPLDELAARPTIDLIYGNPPCFSADTRVLTEDGPVRIKDLVRQRSTARVWSVDADGRRVLKKIIGWHENPYSGKFYDVHLKNWVRGRARATKDHKFLTRRGWTPAHALTSKDIVCTGYAAPNEAQLELLDGALLGDATIKRAQAQLVISQTCEEYVELKRSALNTFICQSGTDAPREMADGHNRKALTWFYLKTDGWVKRERARWYDRDGKKRVPRDVRLTPLSIATWYMDDGARRARTETETGSAMFCTDGFTSADTNLLAKRLCGLGIKCRILKKINRKNGEVVGRYERIITTARGAERLFTMIASYVPQTMRYKLPSWAAPYDAQVWQLGAPTTDWDSVTVMCAKNASTRSHVYCLDIDDTHNFATHGGIVHNCAAWSGNNPRSHDPDAWKVDPRVDCTRRHFGLLERLRPKVWAWESVTQAPDKGRELVDELTDKAMKLGYSVTQVFHDARWLDTPQVRRRWFLVAHRVALRFKAPNWAPPTTALEALARVAPRGPTVDQLAKDWRHPLKQLRPGERLSHLWDRLNGDRPLELNAQGKVRGRPSFGIVRLKTDEPATATVGYGMVHPTEDRFLTVNEVQTLAGFPDDYEFFGREGDRAKLQLIARGVMPPVAAWLARQVRTALDEDVKIKTPEALTVDHRLPPDQTPPWKETPTMPRTASAASREASPTPPVPKGLAPAPTPQEGSGAYMRRLIPLGYGTEQILDLVHKHYPASKAGPSDVAWNRGKLRREQMGGVSQRDTNAIMGAAPRQAELPLVLRGQAASQARPGRAPTEPQPTARGGRTDPTRGFDTTSLTSKRAVEVHRDYAAHFFRWGFARRFVGAAHDVLDVGCGVDAAFVGTTQGGPAAAPRSYLGIDLNRLDRVPQRAWARYSGLTDFTQVYRKVGRFDVILCLEVIEHMTVAAGGELLRGLRHCLKDDGVLLLSTPVFNGKAAKNHIHEYTVEELALALRHAKLDVVRRYGTFASWRDLKKAASREEVALLEQLHDYYAHDVTACFLAPLYPDASRNNVWQLRRKV